MGLLYSECYLNSKDLGVIIFRIRVVWYIIFVFINFRGPRDFINRRGLLIQGGDYIINTCYNPAKPSGRGGGPPPGWEGDLLVL